MKRVFIPSALLLILLLPLAFAFDGNGSTYDFNFGVIGVASDSNASNGTTLTGDILLTTTPTGSFVTPSGNYEFRSGVYFDQNLPRVTINSPANTSVVAVDTVPASVTVRYSTVFAGNPLSNYWVRVDSREWINKGLNTTHAFTGLDTGPHTIFVIATDAYDLNSSTATTNFTLSLNAAGSSPTETKKDTSTPAVGATAGVPAPSAPAVTISDVQDPSRIVSQVNYEPVKATTSEKVEVVREAAKVEVKSASGSTVPVYTFNVGVKNDSQEIYKNVKVREVIPKAIASNVSQITFQEYPATIVSADPEVEWLVEELKPGVQKKFLYFVTQLADKSIEKDFDSYVKNIPTSKVRVEVKKEGRACWNVTCDDSNICTEDSCSDGYCFYKPRDGVNCDNGKGVCSNGKCVAVKTQAPQQPQAAGGFLDNIAVIAGGLGALIVVVVIVVVIAALLIFGRRKK